MITEDYCSFEISKLLKEKGFDEKCVAYYPQCITPIKLTFGGRVNYNSSNKFKMLPPISAPTHQMAIKWLREEKNILIYVYPVINLPAKDDNTFHWRWEGKKKIHCAPQIGDKHNYESFEKAVEIALKYCLENLI